MITSRKPLWWLSAGSLVSNVGGVVQATALSFWLAATTHSPQALGLITFWSLVPALVMLPLGGWLADRMRRTTVLLADVSGQAVAALVMHQLVSSHEPRLWPYCLTAACSGALLAVGVASWQTLLIDAAGSDAALAVSANSVQFSVARSLAPWLAGLMLAAGRPALGMLVNAISFLPVLAALLLARRAVEEPDRGSAPKGSVLADPQLRWVLVMIAVLAALAGPLPAFLPLLVGSAYGLSAITSGYGIGSALGAVWYLRRRPQAGPTVRSAALWLAIGFAALTLPTAPTRLVAAAVVGGAFAVANSALLTFAQTLVTPGMRGRVSSAYFLVMAGAVPLGALLQGWAAARIGLVPVLTALALTLLVVQRRARPVGHPSIDCTGADEVPLGPVSEGLAR